MPAYTVALAAWIVFLGFLALWLYALGLGPFGNAANGDGERRVYFFTYRMLHPADGVSPAIPPLMLLAGIFTWGYMLIARRATVSPPLVPKLGDSRQLAGMVNSGLNQSVPGESLLFALIAASGYVLLFGFLDRLTSVEAGSYDWLIVCLLALNYGVLFAAWAQLLQSWKHFRTFLEALERRPIRKAFSRVPKTISALPLFEREPQKVDLFTSARCCQTAEALDGQLSSHDPELFIGARAAGIRYWVALAERQLAKGLRDRPDAYGQVSAVSHQLEQTVLATADKLVVWAQDRFWEEGESDSLDTEKEAIQGDSRRDYPEQVRILAEEFITLRFIGYIRHVLRQMRSLLWFIVIDFVLTVLALSSYPFEPQRLINASCIGVLIVLGSGIALVLAQVDRDALLSRLSASTPHEVGKTFYLRLASFGALPLLTVVATQFPPVAEFLSGWVQPVLEALR